MVVPRTGTKAPYAGEGQRVAGITVHERGGVVRVDAVRAATNGKGFYALAGCCARRVVIIVLLPRLLSAV